MPDVSPPLAAFGAEVFDVSGVVGEIGAEADAAPSVVVQVEQAVFGGVVAGGLPITEPMDSGRMGLRTGFNLSESRLLCVQTEAVGRVGANFFGGAPVEEFTGDGEDTPFGVSSVPFLQDACESGVAIF